MKKHYYQIHLQNCPAFYRNKLFSLINTEKPILVVYINGVTLDRNQDFAKGDFDYDYEFLNPGTWSKIKQLNKILHTCTYDQLVLDGWDSKETWWALLKSPKHKNAMVIESSYFESKTTGIRGFIKKLFLKKVSTSYCSGKSQKQLGQALGFKGKTIITKGVGIFNYGIQPSYVPRNEVKKFLYVGRFVPVKNLDTLIAAFNEMPQLHLQLAGFGEQETYLKSHAKENIEFLGAIDNQDLAKYYRDADVFILPSLVEPWGLVVEEALNNGTPVLVSDRVGCHPEIVTSDNGIVFPPNKEGIKTAIKQISDLTRYNQMRESVSQMDFESVQERQVQCYLHGTTSSQPN